MSMNVAMDRVKEVVRLGSGEAKAVEPVLQATNLLKQYGSMTVLAEVTPDLLPGEIHAIIGENGAGKTTFMRRHRACSSGDSAQ